MYPPGAYLPYSAIQQHTILILFTTVITILLFTCIFMCTMQADLSLKQASLL